VTYEPNPPPDQVEAFQPFGGKPLTLLKVGAGLLARKGKAEPIIEPSPKKRAELEMRVTKETLLDDPPVAAAAQPKLADPEPLISSLDEAVGDWGGDLAKSKVQALRAPETVRPAAAGETLMRTFSLTWVRCHASRGFGALPDVAVGCPSRGSSAAS
jgi:hypothetical protein